MRAENSASGRGEWWMAAVVNAETTVLPVVVVMGGKWLIFRSCIFAALSRILRTLCLPTHLPWKNCLAVMVEATVIWCFVIREQIVPP